MSVAAPSRPPRPPDSAAEAYRLFAAARFEHLTLNDAYQQIARRLAPGVPPSIVVLEGSTGVGKTTLAEDVVRRVREGAIGPSGPSACPVVSTICPPAGRNGFAFDMTFWHCLARSACSPVPHAHRHPDAEAARLHHGFVSGMRPTLESTRRGALEFLRARSVRLVVIDESQHMADGSGGQSLARQLDVIKTSVDLSEVTFLLVGTYALRAVVMPNGQLARRSSVVHFRPYQLDVEGDLKAFEEIFSQLVQALPLAAPERTLNAVENHTEEILFYCAGCVGVLKEWLLAALQQALEDARTHIPLSLLREKRPDNSTLLGIASDIYAYREDRSRATRSEIERKLGYGPKPIRSPTRSKSPTSSKSSLKPRRKPGVRAPARDPVY